MLLRKTNVALLALCMSASLVVACGPDDDDTPTTGTQTTEDMGGGGGGGGMDAGGGGGGMDAGGGGGGGGMDAGGGGGGMDAGGGGGEDAGGGGGMDAGGGGEDAGGGMDAGGGGEDAGGGMDAGDVDAGGSQICGDGQTTGTETCDGDCPTSPLDCDDGDACTVNAISGSAAQCSAVCDFSQPVTSCDGGNSDGCCPAGCDSTNDADCQPMMGMGGDTGAACGADADCGANGTCVTQFAGGYCSVLPCQGDADCSGDGICLLVDPDTGLQACLDSCASDADCRTAEGYVCQASPNGSVCVPDQGMMGGDTMGNGDAGVACMTDTDCGPQGYGFCLTETQDPTFTGGYCLTAIGCGDGTCGGDNVCINVDQNGTTACVDGCAADADCRTGYECRSLGQGAPNACLPAITGQTGIACTSDADCDAAEQCITGVSGGYCTRGCADDADCPMGSQCSEGFQNNFCLDECASDMDCRAAEGYACGDLDFDGSNECWEAPTGQGVIGDACMDASACGVGGVNTLCLNEADQDFPGGYCSSQCQTDADCGAGAHCGFIDPNDPTSVGACLTNCMADTDCRDAGAGSYACGDGDFDGVNECFRSGIGMGAPGDACTSVTDCAGGVPASCVGDASGFPGGYCIVSGCTMDADCGMGALCLDQQGQGPNVCVASCAMDNDCRAGYSCQPIDMTGTRQACFP